MGLWTRLHRLVDALLAGLAAFMVVATAVATWMLGRTDGYLYTLMSLFAAYFVLLYARQPPTAGPLRRMAAMLRTLLILVAWTALLAEQSAMSWHIVDGRAVDRGRDAALLLPAAAQVAMLPLLLADGLIIGRRAARERAAAERAAAADDTPDAPGAPAGQPGGVT